MVTRQRVLAGFDPVTLRFLHDFGAMVERGEAVLFIGAGLSQSAGLPSWDDLLRLPRTEAGIPDSLQDLPLVAEYYCQHVPGGEESLRQHILRTLSEHNPQVPSVVTTLARLNVVEYWTTNYDRLLEIGIPRSSVITSDSDFVEPWSASKTIVKMHGSIDVDADGLSYWSQYPVIRRADYERYTLDHSRIWALLQATFLTRCMLFVGFSFNDPNIDLVLKLARSVGKPTKRHYTIWKRPIDAAELKLHAMRMRDLEDSGIVVVEVDQWDDLTTLLSALEVRSRPRASFVCGSDRPAKTPADKKFFEDFCKSVGFALAETEINVSSMAGLAGSLVGYSFARALRARDLYDPLRLRLTFRHKDEPPFPIRERQGSIIYSRDGDQQAVRSEVLSQVRAILVLGGGPGSRSEVDIARAQRIPIVPVASTGGTAKDVWAAGIAIAGLPAIGTEELRDWELLSDAEPRISIPASVRLLRSAMHLR